MSSDPLNISDDDASSLDLVWYAGPVRADGDTRTRLAITRHGKGPAASVDLSLTELARLVSSAGVLRWEVAPYGHPGWGDPT